MDRAIQMMRKGLRQIRTTGGQDSDPDRPVPSPRELDALAGAVRRAREYAGKGPAGIGASDGAPTTTTSHRQSTGTRGGRAPRLGSSRHVAIVLVAVAVGAAVAGSALVLSDFTRHVASPAAPTLVRPSGPTAPKPPGTQRTTTSSAKSAQTITTTLPTTTTTTTTTTIPTSSSAAPPGAASAPGLVSITPSQGTAGLVVVVRGRDLFSANGLVLARVDGQPTLTRCPTQTSCLVTIPKLSGGPSRVTVTVTTESGTSNSVSFQYI